MERFMRKSALKVAHRADCLEETLRHPVRQFEYCLLYTSEAADDPRVV